MRNAGTKHIVQDISVASLYLTAKLSSLPVSPRSVLAVYNLLLSSPSVPRGQSSKDLASPTESDIEAAYLSEGTYLARRQLLLQDEALILRTLSFNTTIHLPYHLSLTYLQTLGTLPSPPTAKSESLARRTIEHLNAALLSPQLLYLTHQPKALAVAAIYLAAREVGVKLVECEWWEIFDVDRENLGFLVMSLRSCKDWATEERRKWEGRGSSLMSIDGLEREMNRTGLSDHGRIR